MFAVIEEGSRQFRVSPGDTLQVDYRSAAKNGDEITFDRVMLANGGGASQIGTPIIEGATVSAEVVDELSKGPKLEVQKFRKRKNSRRHTGHRQKFTLVKINAISVPGLEISESAAPVDEQPEDAVMPETEAADVEAAEAEETEES